MKAFLPLIAWSLFAAFPAARAQDGTTTTTTTTTTTLPGDPTPTPATVTVQTTPTTQTTTATVAPVPGQHVAEIELAVSKGSVQAYFGRAPRGEKIEVGGASLSFKLPSTATVTKLVSRDDDSPGSHKVTPDHPWRVTVPFNGAGRYVFNISDWSDDPVVVSAVVKVDGVVLFSGRGSEDDLNGWVRHEYGPGVHKTGSREIAFVLTAD